MIWSHSVSQICVLQRALSGGSVTAAWWVMVTGRVLGYCHCSLG